MKEAKFYEMMDIVDRIAENDVTEGYYPTIDELESHKVMSDLDTYFPIITYFASDPFTPKKIEGYSTNEYKATVKYCKDLLSKIKLDE